MNETIIKSHYVMLVGFGRIFWIYMRVMLVIPSFVCRGFFLLFFSLFHCFDVPRLSTCIFELITFSICTYFAFMRAFNYNSPVLLLYLMLFFLLCRSFLFRCRFLPFFSLYFYDRFLWFSVVNFCTRTVFRFIWFHQWLNLFFIQLTHYGLAGDTLHSIYFSKITCYVLLAEWP